MKYQSGEIISLGDCVTYNGQKGCIALIGREPASGSPAIEPTEWVMNELEILILFDNGARLKLENVIKDDLLVFCRRKEGEKSTK
jgi:hypothetical protein